MSLSKKNVRKLIVDPVPDPDFMPLNAPRAVAVDSGMGAPQKAIVALAEAGRVHGRVLEVGCGTGENTLFLAGRGFEVWGIDTDPRAIEKARFKARARGIEARFEIADPFSLDDLETTFNTVIDAGMFCSFVERERPAFVESLSKALCPGGTYFLLCASQTSMENAGLSGFDRDYLIESFGKGWRRIGIEETRVATRVRPAGVPGWLATIEHAVVKNPAFAHC